MPCPVYQDFISTADAARFVARVKGGTCCVQTIHNWHKRGIKGVKLHAVSFGGVLRTRLAWVEQFLALTNASGKRLLAAGKRKNRSTSVSKLLKQRGLA